MYGVASLIGWSLLAFLKLLASIVKMTWWLAKSIIKGVVALAKLINSTSMKIGTKALSKQGISDIMQIRQDEMKDFDKQCRAYKVFYAIPRGQKGKDVLDVMILNNDIPRINRIFDKMGGSEKETSGGDALPIEASQIKESVVVKVEAIKDRLADRVPKNIEKGVLDR